MFENNPISKWRKYNNNYFLQADQCINCKKIHFPKGYFCKCQSKSFKKIALSGKGKLLTFTQVTSAPSAFINYSPYCIGIIKLDEGIKITAQVADTNLDELKTGTKVQATLRKLYECGKNGIINYGIKFIPIN